MAKNKNVNEQEVAVTAEPLSVPTPRQAQEEAQVKEQVEATLEPVKTRKLVYTGSGSYTVLDGGLRHRFAGGAPLDVSEPMAIRLLKTGLYEEAS